MSTVLYGLFHRTLRTFSLGFFVVNCLKNLVVHLQLLSWNTRNRNDKTKATVSRKKILLCNAGNCLYLGGTGPSSSSSWWVLWQHWWLQWRKTAGRDGCDTVTWASTCPKLFWMYAVVFNRMTQCSASRYMGIPTHFSTQVSKMTFCGKSVQCVTLNPVTLCVQIP